MWTHLFGCISERTGRPEDEARIAAHNDAILTSLPDTDAWPPLTKAMFGWPQYNTPMITYGGRKIHFAAGLKSVDEDLDLWVGKFEGLLRNLYWSEAVVMVQGWILPFCELRWVPTMREYEQAITQPTQEWTFETTVEPALWSAVMSGSLAGRDHA